MGHSATLGGDQVRETVRDFFCSIGLEQPGGPGRQLFASNGARIAKAKRREKKMGEGGGKEKKKRGERAGERSLRWRARALSQRRRGRNHRLGC